MKKQEALRIDYENVKLAKRIVQQRPSLSVRGMVDDHLKSTRNRDSVMSTKDLLIAEL
jgi:hypothetical protein